MTLLSDSSISSIGHSQPLVTVVIPVFNRASQLLRALNSVVAQTFKAIEVIVVDDGSSEPIETAAKSALEAWGGRYSVITRPINQGVSAARNIGIARAAAPWIAFLDSDDEWLPRKLEFQMKMLGDSASLVCHTNESWYRRGKFLNQHKKHNKRGGRILIDSVRHCAMSPSSVVLHRSVFKKCGLFDESLPVCEDYDLWLKVTSRFEVAFCARPMLIKHGGHLDQLSQRYLGMDFYRIKSLRSLMLSYSAFLTETEKKEILRWIEIRTGRLGEHFSRMQNGAIDMRLINKDQLELIQQSTKLSAHRSLSDSIGLA